MWVGVHMDYTYAFGKDVIQCMHKYVKHPSQHRQAAVFTYMGKGFIQGRCKLRQRVSQ